MGDFFYSEGGAHEENGNVFYTSVKIYLAKRLQIHSGLRHWLSQFYEVFVRGCFEIILILRKSYCRNTVGFSFLRRACR